MSTNKIMANVFRGPAVESASITSKKKQEVVVKIIPTYWTGSLVCETYMTAFGPEESTLPRRQ